MTPFRGQPEEQSKKDYNKAHCRTRVFIEQAFGIMKRRFAILGKRMELKPEKASRMIIACMVLHNLAINMNDRWGEPPLQPEQEVEGNHEGDGEGGDGQAVREQIMRKIQEFIAQQHV